MRAALRYGALGLSVLLFLLALRRSGKRTGRLAECLETTEKTNDVQRRMLEAAARREAELEGERKALEEEEARLRSRLAASEEELEGLYPDCEPGAMPPLGPLYDQPVFVDIALAAEPQIVFNAGTHGDAVCMRYEDFAALARPVVGSFATRPAF